MYIEVYYLSSVHSDAFPQRFEHAVKGLNTVGSGGLGQRGQSQGCDGTHLLLLVYQT